MLELRVNGEPREVEVDPSTPLLWVLRDHLDLTGTRYGCGKGLCGTCTVHLDGDPARSCLLPLSAVAGREVTTIEGLSGPVASALRMAWNEHQVPQCGFCQAGQVMSAEHHLRTRPGATPLQQDGAMAGNLCRCGTYLRIHAAIADARGTLAEEGR